jgi:hypothetical protein
MSAVVGYFDTVFAREVYADKLCVKKSDGGIVCLTGDEVESVFNATQIPLLDPSSSGGTVLGTSSSTEAVPLLIPQEENSATTTIPTEEVETSATTTTESSIATDSPLPATETVVEDAVPTVDSVDTVPDTDISIDASSSPSL